MSYTPSQNHVVHEKNMSFMKKNRTYMKKSKLLF